MFTVQTEKGRIKHEGTVTRVTDEISMTKGTISELTIVAM